MSLSSITQAVGAATANAVEATATIAAATVTATVTAAASNGSVTSSILSPPHKSPTEFNSANPIVLFIIQVFIIITFSRLLAYLLGMLRQPRVIAEVVSGILLGPTAFGRIPGFTSHIFPTQSIPFLNLVSHFALVLYLFIIGLEVDFSIIRRNAKVSVFTSLSGLVIPFGLGCAVSVGLYNNFIDKDTEFSHFLLFIGTAMSITAFPVLARILTELDLMRDYVGVIALSAGVVDDVVGWTLLALTIALTSASSGVVVVYVILCTIALVLVLFFLARPAIYYVARRTHSLDSDEPSQNVVGLVLMVALASAWIAEIIGVNAFFGGFLAGLIVPKDKKFCRALTTRIEDLVSTLLIPIYFTTSGLSTNLGLLNSGKVWAWTVCIIVCSFCGKFFGAASAARISGYSFREAGAVGALMSCKGLMELIVLNVGLSAKILNTRVFSMFVLEGLLLTFNCTPLTLLFYPKTIRRPIDFSAETGGSGESVSPTQKDGQLLSRRAASHFTIVLERLENLEALLVFTKLVARPPVFPALASGPNPAGHPGVGSALNSGTATPTPEATPPSTEFHTVQLVELTDRTSNVMKASDIETDFSVSDPLRSLYSTFTSLNGIRLASSSYQFLVRSAFAGAVARRAADSRSEFIVVPWTLRKPETDSYFTSLLPNQLGQFVSPQSQDTAHAAFIRSLFAETQCDVALFIDRGTTATPVQDIPGFYRLFLPFYGGVDDRTALAFVLRLALNNPGISATIVRILRAEKGGDGDEKGESGINNTNDESKEHTKPLTSAVSIGDASTVNDLAAHGFPPPNSAPTPAFDSEESQHADNSAILEAESIISENRLPIALSTVHSPTPLAEGVRLAQVDASLHPERFTVVSGRGRVNAMSHKAEIDRLIATKAPRSPPSSPSSPTRGRELSIAANADVHRSLGDVATAYLIQGVGHNIMVIQSRSVCGTRQLSVV